MPFNNVLFCFFFLFYPDFCQCLRPRGVCTINFTFKKKKEINVL